MKRPPRAFGARLLLAAAAAAPLVAVPRATAAAQQPSPPPAVAPATRVGGVVYDSLVGRPLAGALVQLVLARDPTRAVHATTDSLGRYAVDGLTPGRYVGGFLHPVLDRLGLDLTPAVFDLPAGGAVTLPLAVPGPVPVRAALCGAPAAGDSTGLLMGFVHDADAGGPVAGATVVLTWNEIIFGGGKGIRTERRRVPATVREGGTYVVCGVPTDGALVAAAEAPGRASGLIEVAVPPRGVLVQNFALGDSTSARAIADTTAADAAAANAPRVLRGTARLTGVVRGDRGSPVRGARVVVWGTGLTAVTDDDGAFRLNGLPAGTFSVEARAIGREPRRAAVALASGRTAAVRLTLDAPVRTLAAVTAYGKLSRRASRRSRDLAGFLERQRAGFGRFVTAADIERRNPLYLSDVLSMTPGLRAVSTARPGGYAIRARGGCEPGVILDGVPIPNGADEVDSFVRPQDVMGVEIYLGIGGTPPEFSGIQTNGCGAVAIWTKR